MPNPTTHPTEAGGTRRGRRAVALMFAGLLLFAAACSDDEKASTPPSTTAGGANDGGDDADAGDVVEDADAEDVSTGSTEASGGGTDEDTGPTTTEPLPELTAQEQAYVDAVLSDVGDDPTPILPGADNECLATRWVGAIGGDALAASGLSPEEFAEEGPTAVGIDRPTAEAMADAMGECGATVEQILQEWETSLLGIDPGSDPEVTACLRDAIDVDLFRQAMIETFMGEETDQMDDFQASFEACLPTDG